MATTTTNYALKKYEGTDLFNPLTYENPNSDAIDAAMYYNKEHNCVDATELTTGTVHALTKTDLDAPLFSFTATSVYHAGDTFTLNGTPVTALLTSGETLPEGAYVIGSRVIGFIGGGGALITLFVTKVTDLTPITNIIGNTDISGIGDGTLTGAVDQINDNVDALAAKLAPMVNRNVTSGVLATISVSNNFRGIMIISRAAASNNGVYIISSNSSGDTFYQAVLDNTGILAITNSTNAIKITPSANINLAVITLTGTATV